MRDTLTTAVSCIFSFLCAVLPALGADTHYVRADATNAISPYTSWETAASNIQQAVSSISVFATNDIIIVADGTYGGFLVDNIGTRLGLIKSQKGAAHTIIDGGGVRRCAEIRQSNVTLEGLTLRNGYHVTDSGDGGCVYFYYGGHLRNCIVENGYSSRYGAGIMSYQHSPNIVNCTIVSNRSALGYSGLWALGAPGESPMIYNTIIYSNHLQDIDPAVGAYWSCVLEQLPNSAVNCTTSNPLFLSGTNYRLQASSPCIDSGTSFIYAPYDMDGYARPLDGDNAGGPEVDIGASEYVHPDADSDGDTMPDWWETTYRLNPTVDDRTNNLDGDARNNFAEYVSLTDPGDANDVLQIDRMVMASNNVTIEFLSKATRLYAVDYKTNLLDTDWINIATNVPGSDGTSSIPDTAVDPTRFYRITVGM